MHLIDCHEFKKYFDAYVDGEFAVEDRVAFDAHLASCTDCRLHYENRAWFLKAVRPALQRSTPMPAEARRRLQTRMRGAQRPARIRRAARRLAPVPAAMVAVGAVFLLVTPLTGFVPVQDAVQLHCKDQPVEVPTDRSAEINNWFNGKVSFRMVAPRFNPKGDIQAIQLMGARLSRVGPAERARDAGLLSYHLLKKSGSTKMSVLVFDGSDLDLERGQARTRQGRPIAIHQMNGYQVAPFRHGGLGYAVTADLSVDQMINLVESSF